jgi:predicted RNase H-like HicB family nuclease
MTERLIRLRLERLPEGVYLATSDDLPGLLAQGRTIAETIQIAQDVARKLVESYIEHGDPLPEGLSGEAPPEFDLCIPVAA